MPGEPTRDELLGELRALLNAALHFLDRLTGTPALAQAPATPRPAAPARAVQTVEDQIYNVLADAPGPLQGKEIYAALKSRYGYANEFSTLRASLAGLGAELTHGTEGYSMK